MSATESHIITAFTKLSYFHLKVNRKRTSFLVKLRCQIKTMLRKGIPITSILNTISLESNKKIKINFKF